MLNFTMLAVIQFLYDDAYFIISKKKSHGCRMKCIDDVIKSRAVDELPPSDLDFPSQDQRAQLINIHLSSACSWHCMFTIHIQGDSSWMTGNGQPGIWVIK